MGFGEWELSVGTKSPLSQIYRVREVKFDSVVLVSLKKFREEYRTKRI